MRWHAAAVIPIAWVLLGGAAVPTVAAQSSALAKDYPLLIPRYGAGQPADYVIAIDVSGSMRSYWPAIVDGVTRFVNAIPDGEYVSVLAFGSTARLLATPGKMTPEGRNALALSLQRALPTDGTTDIGAGVEKALVELNRPGGEQLKFVFFFTDFRHDPPKGSAYRTPDAWQRLAERRQRELGAKILDVSGCILPLGGGGPRDIGLFSSVFPETKEAPIGNPSLLAAWFRRLRDEIARDKLRASVFHDVKGPAAAIERLDLRKGLVSADGHLTAVIRIRHPKSVRVIQAAASSVTVSGTPSGLQLKLVEGEQLGTVEGETFIVPIASVTDPSPPFLRRQYDQSLRVALDLRRIPEGADEMTRLDAPPELLRERLEADLSVTVIQGYVAKAHIGGAALLLVGLVGLLLYWRRPEYLVGTIRVVGGPMRVLRGGERKRSFRVGNVAQDQGLAVPTVRWVATVQGARRGELGAGKPRMTFVSLTGATGTLVYRNNRVPVGTVPVPFPRGATVEIADKRVTWA